MSYGLTIFCDDIREEIGGKHTFVGVYNAEMYVGDILPTVVPKFCMAITYAEEKRGEAFPPNAELLIYLIGDSDNKPTFRAPIDFEQSAKDNVKDAANAKAVFVRANLVLSPFVIKEEGVIKVRIKRGKRIIKMGAISVKKGVRPT